MMLEESAIEFLASLSAIPDCLHTLQQLYTGRKKMASLSYETCRYWTVENVWQLQD